MNGFPRNGTPLTGPFQSFGVLYREAVGDPCHQLPLHYNMDPLGLSVQRPKGGQLVPASDQRINRSVDQICLRIHHLRRSIRCFHGQVPALLALKWLHAEIFADGHVVTIKRPPSLVGRQNIRAQLKAGPHVRDDRGGN
jgi:hypothetical protein